MPGNAELIKKADITVAQLNSDGGKLPDDAARQFVIRMIKKAVMLPEFRFEAMASDSVDVSDMGMTQRVLRGGSSGNALPPSDRTRPEFDKAQLRAVELVGEVKLDLNVIENNIEEDNLESLIMAQLEPAIARDLEDLFVNGNTASASAWYSLMNGLLVLIASNTASHSGAKLNDAGLEALIKLLPQEARRRPSDLCIYASTNAEFDWVRSFAARATEGGDRVHAQGSGLPFHGTDVKPVDVFPQEQGGSNNESTAVVMNPLNFVYGLRRVVMIDKDWAARERAYYLIPHLKAACDFVHEPHTAKLTNILSV